MRLEIKIPYNSQHYYLMERVLNSIKNIKTQHPKRYINSIYFDNIYNHIANDNLDGKSKRTKIRLRYYGKNIKTNCFLEIKKKDNKFGQKNIINLKKKIDDLDVENMFKIKNNIFKKVFNDPFISKYIAKDFLTPQLNISYLRNYFYADNVRITHDKDIRFKPIGISKINTRNVYNDYLNVLEVKFETINTASAMKILDQIPLKPKRFSKYLRGLSVFNSAIYL